jgi:dCTP diphosphatase
MMDSKLEALQDNLRSFTEERSWEQFHSPKNLAMAVAGEAGELVAEFQWLSERESERSELTDEKLALITGELADVAIYLLLLADRLEIDLLRAASEKLQVNRSRFPVENEM